MRARNIKPGFFENEDLASLPFEARLLFAGLWCYADREGRFEWRPKRIKALLFPYDAQITPEVIECHLMSLHVMTLILQYKAGENLYGLLPNFKKHQNPHPHEAKSILPPPESGQYVSPTIKKEQLANSPEVEQPQCHDMSLNVTKCNADSLIPDSQKPKNNTYACSASGDRRDCPEPTGLDTKQDGGNGQGKTRNQYDSGFDQAWKNHGRQDGSKYKAFVLWKKLKSSRVLPELQTILDAQNRQKKSKKWQEGFIPYFQTWLNGRLWEEQVKDGAGGQSDEDWERRQEQQGGWV